MSCHVMKYGSGDETDLRESDAIRLCHQTDQSDLIYEIMCMMEYVMKLI